MSFTLVQSPDALLQRQQRFIDLGSIDSSLLVHIHVISTPFVASQVNKGDLAEELLAIFQRYLKNGVRTGGISIG